jgi:predicted cobalt transporter CbtA
VSFTKLLGTAVVAGLLAAFVTAGFHWFFTEPLIDRAVAIEDQSNPHAEEPVVSRPMQKFGLFVGLGVYGVAWGILFGVLVYAIAPKVAAGGNIFHPLLLALILGWSVGLFPMLVYPANPPGVGEAATIGYREELFVLLMALSLIGTVGAFIAENSLRRAGRPMPLLILAAYVAYMFCLYRFFPANPDPVKIDIELVRRFRTVSCAGQIVFWTVLGGAFGTLARYRWSAPNHA